MYSFPRAATIRARSPCKLWYIERNDYHGITDQYKLKHMNFAVELVKNLKFGDKVLGQVTQPSEIDAMVLSTQIRLFKKGDNITREGERGDMLYIIDTGTVDVYKKSSGDKPVASLRSGQFFWRKGSFIRGCPAGYVCAKI
jgi:CRP-like cAMP-binding protein